LKVANVDRGSQRKPASQNVIMKSPPQSSILLLADGLRASSLGPYGNTWFETDSLNRLAAESLLFEQCISDSIDNQLGIQGILTGRHCCSPRPVANELVDAISSAGTDTVLITSNLDNVPESADCFDAVVEVDLPQNELPAADVASTALAAYFAAAVDFIQNCNQPVFLLLDSPGFSNAWDAPYSFRQQLADDDDPEPSELAIAPGMQFNESTDDPDLLFDFQVAYSGQVALFDTLLGILLDEIEQSNWASRALFCLASNRGFPLGEHGVVGYYRPILHTEITHCPLLVRWPKAINANRITGRSQQLVQPGAIYSLLRDWHQLPDQQMTFQAIEQNRIMPNEKSAAVISRCHQDDIVQYSIQTQAWKLINGSSLQLYVKPDDMWDYNNVLSLCRPVAESLEQEIEAAVAKLADGIQPTFELSDALAFGMA